MKNQLGLKLQLHSVEEMRRKCFAYFWHTAAIFLFQRICICFLENDGVTYPEKYRLENVSLKSYPI